MSPSARPNANRAQRVVAWRRYALVVAAIALACSAAWAVENGSRNADSGWAVGTPATAIIDALPPDPTTRNVLHHVPERTNTPLLRERGPKLLHPADGILRVAERPGASDVWHASGSHVNPLMTSPPARSAPRSAFPADLPLTLAHPGPRTAAPHAAISESQNDEVAAPELNPPAIEDEESNSEEIEADCAGQSDLPTDAPTSEITVVDESADEPAGDEIVDESPAAEAPSVPLQDTEDMAADVPADEQPAEGTTEPPAEDTTNEPPRAAEVAEQPGGVPEGNTATPPPGAVPIVERVSLPPLTRQLVNLRSRVRSVLKGYYRKPLNSRENDCWEVMHGMLSYGIHSRVLQGSPRGEPITAVGWLCYNKPCKGLTLMYVTPQGDLRAKWGVGLQGHTGQLLAMLAQCKVSPDYPIHVGKNQYTIRDLIEAEQATCYPKSELTFKLLAFQYYLDLNDKWVNDQGLDWDMPRLIREEIAQPIRGAACGGTHRLSSLSLTVKARQRRGEPLDGEYARAAEFVEKYEKYAFRLQNRDGSLSTEWFRGRGDDDDKDRRIKTTGHILEWLCYSLSDEELRQPQTIRAVSYLANLMYSDYDHEWEVGPRSHAIHALLLYDERVFKPFDKAGEVASYRPGVKTARRTQGQRSTSTKR